ncbi:ankyrin repeat domain-containing protein [Qipengyuania atrilutea]|uniref:ankyrin repeat domain-containing protein n=1 Tax=Qipengyuania atrilutea TaxID=2744473 RepID=UPI00298D7171|nr:ankyrin repeat domain-containing protein [Actirhodobacter atriluteus]
MTDVKFRRNALLLLLAATLATPLAAQRTSEGHQFLEAVRERDGTKVTAALNEPGSTVVNARDITSGESALHVVTKRRDAVWIKFLTGRGANPDIADNRGVTPLQIAASLGFVEGVEALAEAGASLDATNVAGETALITAVHRQDVPMVRILLDNGANPDFADNSGRTARDYAQLQGQRTQVLQAFADADAKREGEGGKQKSYGPSL